MRVATATASAGLDSHRAPTRARDHTRVRRRKADCGPPPAASRRVPASHVDERNEDERQDDAEDDEEEGRPG